MSNCHRWPVVRFLLPLLVTVGLAGCAAAGAGEGSGARTVLIVQNNLIPSSSLSIYAVPETGVRSLVGVANPNETTTLRFNPIGTGQYRFVAETTGGADLVSNPLLVSPGATVRWNLSANIATVVEEG